MRFTGTNDCNETSNITVWTGTTSTGSAATGTTPMRITSVSASGECFCLIRLVS